MTSGAVREDTSHHVVAHVEHSIWLEGDLECAITHALKTWHYARITYVTRLRIETLRHYARIVQDAKHPISKRKGLITILATGLCPRKECTFPESDLRLPKQKGFQYLC